MNPEQTAHRRTEIADRRLKVSDLYLRGEHQTAIAKELGVDQATISRDLTELRKEWLERSINNIDQKKAIELAKIDKLELEYWDAWVRSGEQFKSKVTKGRGVGDTGRVVEQIIKNEDRVGDPRFLDGVMSCIERRCKLLGLDAPTRGEYSGPGGGPLQIEDVSLSNEERLARIAALFDAARARGVGQTPNDAAGTVQE